MKVEEVEGIVLSETNYGESSKILNVLTKEYGLIGIMSKGCRKLKSKLGGSSRRLIHGIFYIHYKENGVSTLTNVDVLHSFSNILMDLEKLSYASYIIDIVKQVARQTEDESLLDLVLSALIKLEEGLDSLVITNILELKLLDYLGVKPSIDACSNCGSTKNIVALSSSHGGYVCGNCTNYDVITEEDTIKTIRLYAYIDLLNIKKIDIKEETSRNINQFLEEYYERYTGLYCKSKDFIKKIKKLNGE